MNRTAFDPGPLAEVDAQLSDGRWTLVFVKDLRHPPEKVWAALTDPAQLGEWSPYTASRDLGSPGAVTLTMIDGSVTEDYLATVLRSDPPSVLEYTWGTDVLRWELAATGSGTRLTLRHTVGGPGEIPRVAAGWHLCLVVAERLLDGQPVGPIRGQDAMSYGWQELHDRYGRKLGVTDTE